MFDKLNSLMDMRKKMQQVKEELAAARFDIRSSGGLVTVTMSGAQEIMDVRFEKDIAGVDAQALARELIDVFNRAVKRSQEVAAQKMKDVTGIKLPGM